MAEQFEKVAGIILAFYKKLLGKQFIPRSSTEPQVIRVGQHLTAAQQLEMCKEFTAMEIREALFSIPNTKSPRLDRYSSDFFKTTWHITGPMVCEAIKEFFNTGFMPRFMSATKLVILPKITHPQAITDFRPISCCNVLYKCISKMLCARIKGVLPHLINQS